MQHAEFIRLYPRLFHVAEDGSWPSIERSGLLTAASLVERWQVAEPLRSRLLTEVRTEPTTITHPVLGSAVVPDQPALDARALQRSLGGTKASAWLELLAARVSFFVQPERLKALPNSRISRNRPSLLVIVDSASLLAAHADRVELCRIDPGAAQSRSAQPRGRDTFQTLEEFRHPSRTSPRPRDPWDVAQLCIAGDVPDILDHVVRVERRHGDDVLEQLR